MDNPFASADLWTGFVGGLALFLFGMDMLTRALKRATGDRMKDLLGRLAGNRFRGVVLGAFVTSVVQSSSVTTVLAVGFVSAGLMTFGQSIGVIMGANIGTTLTAQLLAFRVSAIALPLVAIGVAIILGARSRLWQEYGSALAGLGLIFYGMSVMSDAMAPLRDFEPFLRFIVSMQNPALAVAVGAGFTALVQSSSATTGILIVMAGQGMIGLVPAIGVALGANIGTCITALIAAIGKSRPALRAALVHVLFNVAGVALWIGFVDQLATLARAVSPSFPFLAGTTRMALEVPRQIAWAHTIFNVVNTVLFIGFTRQIAALAIWLVPERRDRPRRGLQPKYLDPTLLDTPPVALQAARHEVARLGKHVARMVDDCVPLALTGPIVALETLAERDARIDALHGAIIGYVGQVSLRRITPAQSSELLHITSTANDLEQIADLVSRDVIVSARKRLADNLVISVATRRIITRFHTEVAQAVHGAVAAFATGDSGRARAVQEMKGTMRELHHELALNAIERLTAKAPKRTRTYTREIELIEILDDIFRLARRIAREQLETEAEADADAADRAPQPGREAG